MPDKDFSSLRFFSNLIFSVHGEVSFAKSSPLQCNAVLASVIPIGESEARSAYTENVVSAKKVAYRLTQADGSENTVIIHQIQTRNAKKFAEMDLFNDPSDIMIGVDTTGRSKGHIFVKVDHTRVDGNLYFMSPTVRTQWTVNTGIVFRYKNVPKTNMTALNDWIRENSTGRGLSCSSSACSVLFDTGQFVSPIPGGSTFSPKVFTEAFLQHPLKSIAGENISLPAEIYVINSDLETVLENLMDEKAMLKFLLTASYRKDTYKHLWINR